MPPQGRDTPITGRDIELKAPEDQALKRAQREEQDRLRGVEYGDRTRDITKEQEHRDNVTYRGFDRMRREGTTNEEISTILDLLGSDTFARQTIHGENEGEAALKMLQRGASPSDVRSKFRGTADIELKSEKPDTIRSLMKRGRE